jgi:type II secretory pathway pseudopilin PulG
VPDDGYAMAGLLVALGVLAVVMSAASPVWQTAARREREAELIFRGEQYARAIRLFQQKYANTLPPNLDVLINEHFLRKKYLDPITRGEFQLLGSAQAAGATATTTTTPGRGQSASASLDTRATPDGLARQTGGIPGGGSAASNSQGRGASSGTVGGGIMGVTSRSSEKSLRLYNGRGAYNEWAFVPVQRVANPGDTAAGGANGPGARGRGAPPDGGRGGLRPGADSFRPGAGSGDPRGPSPPPASTPTSPFGNPRGR